jgi:hypothetical protein
MDLSTNLTIQQARIEDITLKEDYGHMIITQDDDFGDMGFGMASLLMNGHDRDDLLFDHMAMGTTEPLADRTCPFCSVQSFRASFHLIL